MNRSVSYLSIQQILNPESFLDDWQLAKAPVFDYSGLKLSNLYLLLEELQKGKDQILSFLNKKDKARKPKELNLVLCDLATLFFDDTDWTVPSTEIFNGQKGSQENTLILGLLLDEKGHLYDFDIFAENNPDIHTMMSFIYEFQERAKSNHLTVVTDESTTNLIDLDQLQDEGYAYVACEPTRLDHEGIMKFIKESDKYIEEIENGIKWGTLEWENYWENIEWEDEVEEQEAFEALQWSFKEYTTQRGRSKDKGESKDPSHQYPRIFEVSNWIRRDRDLNKLNEKASQFSENNRDSKFFDVSSDYYKRKFSQAGHISILTNLPGSSKSIRRIVRALRQLWSVFSVKKLIVFG